MSRWTGLVGALLVLIASMAFAGFNGGQRVTVRLGFVTLYQVSLTVVVFSSLITGMVAMLIASIASDLEVRRILRERLAAEQEEEQARLFVDRTQTNLFEAEQDLGGNSAPED